MNGLPSLAVIGLGRIARTHLDALAQHPVVPTLFGVEPDATKRLAAPPGMVVWPTVADLLEGVKPDAAIVCTPPSVRWEVLEPLLERGVHVLVEKPLALSGEEAERLVALAMARGCVLDTASKFTAMPSAERVRHAIAAGKLGKLEHATIVFSGLLDIRSDWRANRVLGGGGVWADNGPHAVDLASYLLGPVTSVRLLSAEHAQGTDVEDACVAELIHQGGATTRIDLSWNEGRPAPIAHIKGERGTVDIGWRELTWNVEGEQATEPGGYDKLEAFARLQKRFFDRIASVGDIRWDGAHRGAATASTVMGAYPQR